MTYHTEQEAREKCKVCHGTGAVQIVVPVTEPGCCGNPLPSGECCGNAVPIYGEDITIERCADCQGSGLATQQERSG